MKQPTPMLRTAFPLALLALAACSEQPDTPAAEPSAAASNEPQSGPPEVATPSPSPAIAEDIPDRFQGVWDRLEGDCAAVSETRMEVRPKSIDFYESHGEVTRVEVDNPDRIVVSLAMAGEGETWQRAQQFTLSEGGSRLTSAPVDEEQFEPIQLKKCPTTGG